MTHTDEEIQRIFPKLDIRKAQLVLIAGEGAFKRESDGLWYQLDAQEQVR